MQSEERLPKNSEENEKDSPFHRSKVQKKVIVSSERGHLNRLTKLYPKPKEGDAIPITVLEVERKEIGWSPKEGKSVYINESMDVSTLKRVRAVNEVRIFNWLAGSEGLIELTDEEMGSLRSLLNEVSVSDESKLRVLYTRVKVKGKMRPHFTLDESEGPRRGLLSDQL